MIDLLIKLGVPAYTDTYYTLLNGSGQTKIGQDMPTPVGYIFGLANIPDNTLPADSTKLIITTAESSRLWLFLKVGTNLFMNNFRLDKLNFEVGAVGATVPQFQNPRRYLPVSIPKATDLKESYYQNPTGIGIVSGPRFVALQIHYIDLESYNWLVAKKYLFKGGATIPTR